MLKVKRFINELMSSNCYIIFDETFDDCIVIDPASEKCVEEQSFFNEKGITPSYIVLTHEHTDHTWGTNILIDKFDVKVVCSKVCSENLLKEFSAYFSFYYNDIDYKYNVKRIDILLEDINYHLIWHGREIKFFNTPGHSMGSVCLQIEDMLFTGDTWMQYKPYINKRNGSKVLYKENLQKLKNYASEKNLTIYPGHGDPFNPYN